MHGISRQRGNSSEEQKAKNKAKIDRYVQVTEALKARREAGDYSEESLKISGDVLSINSEYYTAWSFRRRLLESLDDVGASSDSESPAKSPLDAPPPLYEHELRFCEQLLAHHPKSYWLWLHRTWLLQRLERRHGVSLWESELALCTRFLDADRRNFHGWNHRRWVAERCGVGPGEELAYTTAKIEQDFSNYSAWQHRARLYQELLAKEGGQESGLAQGLDAEFELVRQAFFTEPDDQSPWFYYRWLLNQAARLGEGGAAEVFARELGVVEELLEEEPDSKWALLTSIDLMQRMRGLKHDDGGDEGDGRGGEDHNELIQKRYKDLIRVDPFRRNYYLYLQSK